jgi:small conductance mechanosensitive channel
MLHLFTHLFSPDFWTKEELALRDTSIEVLRVIALYVIGRFVINRSAAKIAQAVVNGSEHFGHALTAGNKARLRTVIGLVRSVGVYILFFVCAILLLRALDFDAVSVITSASVAGIAVGFGAQKLFKDVISGFFIILENQYAVGDYVSINGIATGRVEEMGMRIVKVRDDSGKLFIFANGDITTVCNLSRGAISAVIEIGVPPGSDMGKARNAIESCASEIVETRPELRLTKSPVYLGVGSGDSTRTVLRIIVEVDDPAMLAAANAAVRDGAHAKLLAAGITPF